jgi:hypothetical protein
MKRSLTVSPQMKVVMGVVLAAVVGLFVVFTFVLGKSSTSTPTVKRLHPDHPIAAATAAPSKTTPAAAPATRRGPVAATTAPATIPPPPPKPAIQLVSGLPPVVARALRRSTVVVVSLLSPGSAVDGIAAREASDGARKAHVAWVPLDVLDEKQARPLLNTLNVLQDPGVLIYVRPGTVLTRFDGFADRDLVAQAAANATAK